LYFKYLQHNIQQEINNEIKEGLNEKDLSVVIIPLKDENKITWTKKNKEFKYKGLMYDVVKTKIKNGKKYYYCINDVKEKKLITSFFRNNRRKNKSLLKLKKILSKKYLSKKFSKRISIKNTNLYLFENQEFYKSKILEVLSPPPEFNFSI
jgi:predicted transcriptional regulator